MAHTLSHLPLFLSSSSPSLSKFRVPSNLARCRVSAASPMDSQGGERLRFKEFPYSSGPIRDLMVDLVSTVESSLDPQLLPCTVPHDVEYYHNQSGTAHGSLFLRSGAASSPIDFILGSWLHCELPTGGALSITSLISYMNDSTDAPHLVIEFIQNSPTSLVIILDLAPRRDLVLHEDYLKTFYEDTGLERQRQLLGKISEVQPYLSPSLFVRCAFSPTAVLIRVDTTSTGGERLEDIVRDDVSVAAKEVLGIWLDMCVFGRRRQIGDDERDYLKKRDSMFKVKSIETDLGSTLPRMFGQEIANRVLGVLRSVL